MKIAGYYIASNFQQQQLVGCFKWRAKLDHSNPYIDELKLEAQT